MTAPYVELHCHSGYSFLDGASHPEELILQARALGYPALALTDHDGLYGSMEFARFARAEGVQPITGAEVTVDPTSVEELKGWPGGRIGAAGGPTLAPPGAGEGARLHPRAGFHLTLLAESPAGYANLCRLLTRAHMGVPADGSGYRHGWDPESAPERGEPRLPLPALLEHTEGLICLTGCRRSPLRFALEDSVETAESLGRRLARAFGPDSLFLELQANRVRGDARRLQALGRLADRLGLPVVATGNVHYHRRERHRLQDALVAIRCRSTLDGSHALRRPNSEFHLRCPEEMARRFRERPDAVTNTLRIAERCGAFDLTEDLGYSFPDFEGSGHGKTAIQVLAGICHQRLEERYPAPTSGSTLSSGTARDSAAPVLSQPGGASPGYSGSAAAARARKRAEAERRLEEELSLVEQHGLGGFFLVYRDIMELAREVAARVRGDAPRARSGLPPGRGRGSSVSSIICYLIGLSHVDPVETDLFLGRFLNQALGSVPDIDLDFPRDIREELILAVYEKYGADHAGLVCTFPTYRFRSAVRELGKVLDLPAGDLEKLTKLGGHGSAAALRGELERIPEFRDRAHLPPWSHLAELAEEVAGLPRHISQHVGGMIISSRPLLELVPLEPAAMEGRVLCQWDKDSCDDAGFIKIDFLALGMLSLVEEAVDLIAERRPGSRSSVSSPSPPKERSRKSRSDAGEKPCLVERREQGENREADEGDHRIGGYPPSRGAGGEPLVEGAPDLSRIDFRDEAVYDRICSGDTVGLFQVESRAQIQMLRRVRPRNLKELAIQVAIVRPGPIVGGAVNPYVRRRELQREDPDFTIPYDHPLLEDALEETLGVIIYQDQVLEVCRDLAGFTDGQAEGLRRAMSRKRSRDAMEEYWNAFLRGARERGVDETTARTVFRQVVAFSEFGFPKSHAAAFGLLAYQSAWLRHYYPVEYYVALFNNQPMGFYSLDALGRDARRNGVSLLLPDVNRSEVRCTAEFNRIREAPGPERVAEAARRWSARSGRTGVRDAGSASGAKTNDEKGALRVGLGFVRGWGEEICERVVEERERNGPYRSLLDFLRRTPAALKRPAVENLIWVGGFDAFGLTRRELLWQVGLWLGPESDPSRVGGRNDHPQLEMDLENAFADLPFPDLDDADRMVAEYRTLRFATSAHPFSVFADRLPPETVGSNRLADLPDGTIVTVAGIVTARQRPKTAKGYTFVLIDDEYGSINSIVKPRVYEKHRATVRMEPFIVVRGRLQKDGDTINVIAFRVWPLRLEEDVSDEELPPAREWWGTERDPAAKDPAAKGPAERDPNGKAPKETAGAKEGRGSGGPGPAHPGANAPDPFRFLTALRQTPPGAKSWG